jgi:hypothetical protein
MTRKGPNIPRAKAGNRVFRRLSSEQRRQILKVAEKQFAASGLGSATTVTIAKTARVSETVLDAGQVALQTKTHLVICRTLGINDAFPQVCGSVR